MTQMPMESARRAPDDVPAALEARRERVRARLAALDVAVPASLEAEAVRAAVVSDFVLSVLERQTWALIERVSDDAGADDGSGDVAPVDSVPVYSAPVDAVPVDAARGGVTRIDADRVIERLALDGLGAAAAMARLRQIRNVEMARLAWLDLAGRIGVRDSLEDLSELAEGLIRAAYAQAEAELEPRFGRPLDSEGKPAPLIVLGMGKLGGRELNYSSDVDLVFVHPDDVHMTKDGADPADYYRRVAQALIRLLDQPTDDGFVLRVDTRLRPFGQSGPLVVGVAAFESYLVQHARDWERYAYVKARAITGRRQSEALFAEILVPYVYRRYLDYGVFEALRHMKRLIAQDTSRKDLAGNLKLGPGGIREIEFVVQAFQLVRGGRDPSLRTPSLLEVLPRLADERELGAEAVERLRDSYLFLRSAENRVQAMDDRQTHSLPTDPEALARLAFALGFDDAGALETALAAHRRAVQSEFERVAFDGRDTGTQEHEDDPVVIAWEDGEVAGMLAGTALEGDEASIQALTALRSGSLYQRMDKLSRRRLSAAIASLVPRAAEAEHPSAALTRVLGVYHAICRRSAYLALINENPGALARLVDLAGRSAMLARQIAEHPLLLDELLDSRVLEAPPTRSEFEEMFATRLARAGDDLESRLDAMRDFQRTAVFRVAVADRLGSLPLMKVSDRLTDIAEIVLGFALSTAWAELAAKHGRPMFGEPPDLQEAGFAVIGYGKLGGLELGYGSDLDLVFLHDSSGSHQETDGAAPIDNARFFSRLVQRLIHYLTIQTSSGRLYEVDTRLRPSGGAGLMVASVENFRRYQREEAWVFEHQALLRSRALAGAQAVRDAFEAERRAILVDHVARDRLQDEVAKMRARMRRELSQGGADRFDLKQDAGGLADIEFLADYLVLQHAHAHPQLVDYPDNVRQLEGLAALGLLAPERAEGLKAAYLELRRHVHELALDERGRTVPSAEMIDVREFVIDCWAEVFGETPQALV